MLGQAIKGAERSAVQWIPFCIFLAKSSLGYEPVAQRNFTAGSLN
jgi:hypothetical protein